MLEFFEEIPLSQSTLYRKVYRSEALLLRHLQRYAIEDYDCIAVFKFSDHLPTLDDVWKNLRALELVQQEASEIEGANQPPLPFRLVRVLEQDWFLEICAALGGIGGLAAALQLIYTIIHDRQVTRTRRVPYTVNVPTGGGMMQSQTRYREQEEVQRYIGSANGKISCDAFVEEYEERLELIEVYRADGRVERITNHQIRQIIRGNQESSE